MTHLDARYLKLAVAFNTLVRITKSMLIRGNAPACFAMH
jgi:hypothetical protein